MQYGIKWLFTLEICCSWYTIKNMNATYKNILFIVNVLLQTFRIKSKYSILQKKVIILFFYLNAHVLKNTISDVLMKYPCLVFKILIIVLIYFNY